MIPLYYHLQSPEGFSEKKFNGYKLVELCNLQGPLEKRIGPGIIMGPIISFFFGLYQIMCFANPLNPKMIEIYEYRRIRIRDG